MSLVRTSLGAVLCLATLVPAFGQQSTPAAKPPAQAARPSAWDKPTLEAYVRHRFFWGPQYNVRISDPKPAPIPGFKEVEVEVSAGPGSNRIPLYISDNGQKIIFGEIYDIEKSPFANDLSKLKTDFQPSFGAPGAPVVLVLFSDFQCAFCREESVMLRENIRKEYPTQVRVYFKDYPLEAIHPWAKAASIAGRCVFRQNAAGFWDFHDWIYTEQPNITPENLRGKVLDWAATKNLETLQLTQCIDRRTTEGDVNRNIAEGKSLNIDSTPTMYINGRKLVGKVDWSILKQVIDREIEYQKTAKNAGEQACCEIKLPSALPNQ